MVNFDFMKNDRIRDIGKINIIVGKNGSGKSLLLHGLLTAPTIGGIRTAHRHHVSPERGGLLIRAPGIEKTLHPYSTIQPGNGSANQEANFRQRSLARFFDLETSVYRGAERNGEVANVQAYVDRLNELLDYITLQRGANELEIVDRSKDKLLIDPGNISSGESELISLGIELLHFAVNCRPEAENFLLLDEPDAHLHPDLQNRFAGFLIELARDYPLRIILTTHSTALISGLNHYTGSKIAFMTRGQPELRFEPIDGIFESILPVFGAHPLSSAFNASPIALIEGEDDERMWQQAVRSSKGHLKIYPVVCSSKQDISRFERRVQEISAAIYDDVIAYSIRDGDGIADEIEDNGSIFRMRLNCYSAENLMLTDEVLASHGLTWPEAKASMDSWIASNTGHQYVKAMLEFQGAGYDRRNFKLKDVRMILVGSILGSTKTWEVVVGQKLGALASSSEHDFTDGSLADFLGQKIVSTLLSPDQETPPA